MGLQFRENKVRTHPTQAPIMVVVTEILARTNVKKLVIPIKTELSYLKYRCILFLTEKTKIKWELNPVKVAAGTERLLHSFKLHLHSIIWHMLLS